MEVKVISFYCDRCQRNFGDNNSLQIHLQSKRHLEAYVHCSACSKSFPHISSLTQHLESGACRSGINRSSLNQTLEKFIGGSRARAPKAIEPNYRKTAAPKVDKPQRPARRQFVKRFTQNLIPRWVTTPDDGLSSHRIAPERAFHERFVQETTWGSHYTNTYTESTCIDAPERFPWREAFLTLVFGLVSFYFPWFVKNVLQGLFVVLQYLWIAFLLCIRAAGFLLIFLSSRQGVEVPAVRSVVP